jgi:hypothetical protein
LRRVTVTTVPWAAQRGSSEPLWRAAPPIPAEMADRIAAPLNASPASR